MWLTAQCLCTAAVWTSPPGKKPIKTLFQSSSYGNKLGNWKTSFQLQNLRGGQPCAQLTVGPTNKGLMNSSSSFATKTGVERMWIILPPHLWQHGGLQVTRPTLAQDVFFLTGKKLSKQGSVLVPPKSNLHLLLLCSWNKGALFVLHSKGEELRPMPLSILGTGG